jgi:hypothetical protein
MAVTTVAAMTIRGLHVADSNLDLVRETSFSHSHVQWQRCSRGATRVVGHVSPCCATGFDLLLERHGEAPSSWSSLERRGLSRYIV